ncbi:MAG: OB-fold domain-containing protein [Pseudomonadales bacterium]|nr:OB-fold domain-containing protein [Pseudomonadales bacterium]
MSDSYQEEFWAYCARQELCLQQCENCGELRYPPAALCAHCLSEKFIWQSVEGRGTLISGVVFHHAFRPELADRIPYGIGLVELNEGVRMVTAIVDSDLSALTAGRKVSLRFIPDRNGRLLPCFRIVD